MRLLPILSGINEQPQNGKIVEILPGYSWYRRILTGIAGSPAVARQCSMRGNA
jgi:hypothetical protein